MIRETLLVLGIGAVVVGLAPIAQAQSTRPSSSSDNSVTLSGDSLRLVERRSVSGDYGTFFNDSPQLGQGGSVVDVGRLSDSRQPSPLGLNNQVDVVIGDTLNRQNSPTGFPSSGDSGDRNRVKVQLQVGE